MSSGSFEDGLRNLVHRLDRRGGQAALQAQVAAVWPEIAGPTVMKHTTGAHVRGNELVIYVDNPGWAHELQAMSGQYLSALKNRLGKFPVSRMAFTVSRRVAEEHRIKIVDEEKAAFYVEDRVDSIPLSDIEREQVEASAERIPDPELRKAVLRATIADLEWKKGIAAQKKR